MGALLFAYRRGWLDEICLHMPTLITYWDFDACKKEALKYHFLKDFRKKSGSAYNHAMKKDFIKEISTHYSK